MRTRGWWLVLVGMMAALCMVTSVSAATTYTDPQGRFSFTVPDGYQRSSAFGPNIPVFVSPTLEGANLNIVVSTVPTGTTLVPLIPTPAQVEAVLTVVCCQRA